jgi:hypothetical protein
MKENVPTLASLCGEPRNKPPNSPDRQNAYNEQIRINRQEMIYRASSTRRTARLQVVAGRTANK